MPSEGVSYPLGIQARTGICDAISRVPNRPRRHVKSYLGWAWQAILGAELVGLVTLGSGDGVLEGGLGIAAEGRDRGPRSAAAGYFIQSKGVRSSHACA